MLDLITKQPYAKQIAIAAVLAFFMVLTRGSHVLTSVSLPDASLVLFLLGGMYLGAGVKSRAAWFTGFFVLATVIDFGAAAVDPVQGFCLTNGYWGLIPSYAAMWLGGLWLANRKDAFEIKPAVAIATVRQVSRATIAKNSAPCAGGKKLARKLPPERRLSGASKIQGLNSVATINGHSSTSAAEVQNSRPSQAGSRIGGWRLEAISGPARWLSGTASPPGARAGPRPAPARRLTPVRHRAARVHAGHTAGPACRE